MSIGSQTGYTFVLRKLFKDNSILKRILTSEKQMSKNELKVFVALGLYTTVQRFGVRKN